MKIVVTGASGFIGRALTNKLVALGHDVVCMGRVYVPMQCDMIYHLACPSSPTTINENPLGIVDIIIDKTREALAICSSAFFVNASSWGASQDINVSPQACYNVAKKCMEYYVQYDRVNSKSYRIPSVYGEGMGSDRLISLCVSGYATRPTEPTKMHYISHVDDVVDAMINLTEIPIEMITLGEIYEEFNSGRRGLHRPTPGPQVTE